MRDRVLVCDKYLIFVAVSSLPQGSPLSPILFIIYCDYSISSGDPNDCFFHYADDSSATITGKTWAEVEEKVKSILKHFEIWCRQNGLALSTPKTELLLINKKKTAEDEVLKKYVKSEVRLLGIFVDSNMNFSYYVNVILQKKLNCLLYCMKCIAGFTRLSFRRCFLFSVIQTYVWPLFPIMAMSNSLKSVLQTWFFKFARAALRFPKFVDMGTVQSIIGMETFENLITRQISTKVVSIDARTHFYQQNNIPVENFGHREIYTKIERIIEKPVRKLRFERPELPYLYNRKIVQNEVFECVNAVVKIDKLPWRQSENYLKNVDFKSVKWLSRETVNHLKEKRRELINSSLYAKQLKKAENRAKENEYIQIFVESRRNEWNYVPPCMLNCEFEVV